MILFTQSHQRGRDRGPPGGGGGGGGGYGGGGGGYGGGGGGGYGGGGGGGGYGGGARAGGAAPRTGYKVRITGLPEGMRWSELKDFVRKAGDVTYADVRGDEG